VFILGLNFPPNLKQFPMRKPMLIDWFFIIVSNPFNLANALVEDQINHLLF
jgi:hypothetical protein